MPTKADSPTKTCTTAGCAKPLRAKGMCVTHYNQQNVASHKTITVPCDGCGTPCEKEPSRLNRYTTVYCSPQCKTDTQWAGQWLEEGASCTLPADHWARWYGKTCEWAPPLAERGCDWCGTEYLPRMATHTMCTPACRWRAKAVRRRAREHGAQGTYTWMEVTRIWVSINRCCAYCDQPTLDYEPDHVVPLSKGGSNSITNVVPSCKLCNSDKRDLSLIEWYDDRARRQLPARILNPSLTHLTWAVTTAA